MESVTRSKRSDKNAKEKQQGRRKKQRLDVNVASLSESKDSAPKLGKQKSGDDSAEWNRMFFELMLYKANNGNINVKSSDSENSELHKWVLHQRKQYKLFQNDADSSSLTPDRIKVLESVRFAFTTRGEDHWNRNFEKLKEFRKVHGHVLVPRLSEEAGLGDWVSSYHGFSFLLSTAF